MPELLLRTKLYVPPLRPNFVPRSHLIERLNQGLQYGHVLTLISAAAGFGKTTLLSEWISQHEMAAAWLSLDVADNDAVRFLSYLIAAVQTIDQTIGRGLGAALQSPRPPDAETVLTSLINQISAMTDDFVEGNQPAGSTKASPEYVLILDDYHLIFNPSIHDTISYLLDHLPGSLHLVIATRSDPPFPLARLRGRGLMTELREADLRFNRGEVAQFIERAVGLELLADDLSALASRTEGWIAGLQMAAVSMLSQVQTRDSVENISDFITDFTGSNRYILDYLVEEVLQSQPEDIQTFLLYTAILDRLTAPLCTAVLTPGVGEEAEAGGQFGADSQDLLERLERANLFIVPLDNERRWYRYHHLFADLLLNQLNKKHPGLRLTLHQRASHWYEQEGAKPEAIRHSVAAENFNRAADLLESIVSSLLNESRPATLLSLMALIPGDIVAGRPWLAVHGAWAYFMTWQFDAIEPLLQSVDQHLDSGLAGQQPSEFADARRIRVRSMGLRAFMAQWQGDLETATSLSYQALQEMEEGDLQLRSVLESNLADICLLAGDLASARLHAENSFAAGKSAGNFYSALSALCRLAELDVAQGRLHQAAETFERAVRYGVEWGEGQPMPGTGRAYVGLAQVLYEWNDLKEAERLILRGLRLGEECGAQEIILPGYLIMARLRQAQGETQDATQALEKAAAIASENMTILPAGHMATWQARISLSQGQVLAASRWADSLENPLDSADLSDFRFAESYLTLVRVRVAQGRLEEAINILDLYFPFAEEAGLLGQVIEVQMLRALALRAGGEVAQALATLEKALALAGPEGYVRTFVDEGLPMAHLLYEAAERGIAVDYAGHLLAAFSVGGDEPPDPETTDSPTLIEPLSKRELEVVRLIAEGLTNQEIANSLFLSLNTVKGHTRKIYGKLGVNNRTQAVAKAKALGIQFS